MSVDMADYGPLYFNICTYLYLNCEALSNSVLWKVLYKFIVIINNNIIIIQLPLILFFDDQPLPDIDTLTSNTKILLNIVRQ